MEKLKDELIQKIKILNETIWEGKAPKKKVDRWLDNFSERREKLHALHLLSQFMYFGLKEMRELLISLYRDLYKYPVVRDIRRKNGDTTDIGSIERNFYDELNSTRFLGVGNPSESGTHLLYYFRQENNLPKTLFINTHQIFKRYGERKPELRDRKVKRYVFIDDLCGSGTQGIAYSRELIEDLKKNNSEVHTAYYVLFAMKEGLEKIIQETRFDSVDAIYKLDENFKCFNGKRYFVDQHEDIDPKFAKITCRKYGRKLWPACPLGYKNGQLLLGFNHNVPDNTLPIIWYDEPKGRGWNPIFRRYPKIYE